MAAPKNPQFKKAKNGSWVVFGQARQVSVGTTKVRKKNGDYSTVQITKLGKYFHVDGVQCVYGYLEEKETTHTNNRRYHSKSNRGVCDECGEYKKYNSVCWETGLSH